MGRVSPLRVGLSSDLTLLRPQIIYNPDRVYLSWWNDTSVRVLTLHLLELFQPFLVLYVLWHFFE